MIELQNVVKSFNHRQVIHDFSLLIPTGASYALIGPARSGKSTLIRMMQGIYKADRGQITYDGEKIYDNPAVKCHIATIAQDRLFSDRMTLKKLHRIYQKSYETFDEERYQMLVNLTGIAENQKYGKSNAEERLLWRIILSLALMPDVLMIDINQDDFPFHDELFKIITEDQLSRKMTLIVTARNARSLHERYDHIVALKKGQIIAHENMIEREYHVQKLIIPDLADKPVEGLKILYEHEDTLIVENDQMTINQALKDREFIYTGLTPEELFIFELGGEADELKKLIF